MYSRDKWLPNLWMIFGVLDLHLSFLGTSDRSGVGRGHVCIRVAVRWALHLHPLYFLFYSANYQIFYLDYNK